MTSADLDTPGRRLRWARLLLKLSGEEFGERLGMTKAAISSWETERTGVTKVLALAIEHVFGISSRWVMDCEGGPWAERPDLSGDSSIAGVPLLPGSPTCGSGGEISDPGPNALRIPFRKEFIQELLSECGGGSEADLFVAEVAGESMRPTVLPGDRALINTALELRLRPNRNALYLVRPDPLSADARIKRVRLEADGQLCFLSDAPGFAPVTVQVDGNPIQSLILGRVCWVGRSVVQSERLDRNW